MADELQDNYEVVRTDELDNVIAANVRLKKFLTDLLSDQKSEKVAFDILEAALIHDNLDELKMAAAGVTYGHINAIAQIIDGVKTFMEFPITPSTAPTTDYQASNKKYVDDGLALKANLSGDAFTGNVSIKAASSSYTLHLNDTIQTILKISATTTNNPILLLSTSDFEGSDTVGASISADRTNIPVGGSTDLVIYTSLGILLSEKLRISSTGVITSLGTYNNTSANAANMVALSDGTFARSTSSEKYKKDINKIDLDFSSKIYEVAKNAAIFYKSKSENDNPDHTFYGISAEKLAKIEPRLVFWGFFPEDYEIIDKKVKSKQKDPKTGKTKEVETVKKEKVLKKDAKLSPVGVQYDRFVPLILVEMDRQNDEIKELKAELKAIKEHLKIK